jgi:hypothetical protein
MKRKMGAIIQAVNKAMNTMNRDKFAIQRIIWGDSTTRAGKSRPEAAGSN